MAKTKSYPFVAGGPDRLELSWGRGFKNLVVSMDGQQVNPEPFTSGDIKNGQGLTLPDGSRLFIEWARGFGRNEFQVSRDGRPLPGSAHHPVSRARAAAVIMWIIAGLTLVGSAILYFSEDLFDWIGLVSVIVYAALGLFVYRGSSIALWIGLILYGVDTAAWIFLNLAAGEFPFAFTIIRVGLILALARAVPALRELKEEQETSIVS